MLTSYKRKIYTGKNITWNQLVDISNFTAKTILGNVVASKRSNDTIHIEGSASSSGGRNVWGITASLTANHKYYVYQSYANLAGPFLSLSGQTSKYFQGEFITCDTSGTYLFGYNIQANVQYNTDIQIMLFDLTLMFGAGNEPTTPAEFWSHFGRKYYQYNTGETQPLFLIGRKNKVFQKTKNLLQIPTTRGYPSDTAFSNTTKRTWTYNTYVAGAQSGNYYDPGSVDSYEIISQGIKVASRYSYGVGFVENLKAGSTYTISYDLITDGVATYEAVFYSQDGSRISATANKTFTVPNNTVWSILIFKTNAGAKATFAHIQLEEGTTATSYEPYGYLQSIKSKTKEG